MSIVQERRYMLWYGIEPIGEFRTMVAAYREAHRRGWSVGQFRVTWRVVQEETA